MGQLVNPIEEKERKDSKEILKLWFSNVVDSILNNDEIWTDKLYEIKYELKKLSKKREEDCMVILGFFETDKCFAFNLQRYPDDHSTPIYPEPTPKLNWKEVNDIVEASNGGEFWHRIDKEGHDLDKYEIFLTENKKYKKTGRMINYGNFLEAEKVQVVTGYKLVLRVGTTFDPTGDSTNKSSCTIL